MSIIRLKEANCRNCYKCIRECPVKSISFSNEQAQIIDNECVLCAHCLFACPQHAKEIVTDVPRVKNMIAAGHKVYVSLAPSYPSYYKGVKLASIVAALKKLGVVHVEETALGATKVSEEYGRIMNEGSMDNIITTCCPSVVLLVEKYFPDLIHCLAPVASPVIVHARAMKEVYGPRIKVVFIGPCISKKHDVEDVTNENVLSAALSFEELDQWMEIDGVSFDGEDGDARGIRYPTARFYPVPGGIIKTIPKPVRKKYKCAGVDGMDRCISVLKSMREGGFSHYFLEMNACQGGCIGGPSLNNAAFFLSQDSLIESINSQDDRAHYVSDDFKPDMKKLFVNLTPLKAAPTEEDIRLILAKIGKTRPEDELNCGGCGYPTCREKAIAVFEGKAEEQMCLPYIRQKAESKSNMIMDCSPNAILVLDENLAITEANPATAQMLGLSPADIVGKNIDELLPCGMYYATGGENVQVSKQTYEQYGIIVEQTLVRVENSSTVVVLLKDITEIERQKEADRAMREGTIAITQKVIDKQMRVAQEIASLLGETTAETKVALTKLKKSMMDGEAK